MPLAESAGALRELHGGRQNAIRRRLELHARAAASVSRRLPASRPCRCRTTCCSATSSSARFPGAAAEHRRDGLLAADEGPARRQVAANGDQLDERDSRPQVSDVSGRRVGENQDFVDGCARAAAIRPHGRAARHQLDDQPAGHHSALCGAKRPRQIEETAGAMGWTLRTSSSRSSARRSPPRGRAAANACLLEHASTNNARTMGRRSRHEIDGDLPKWGHRRHHDSSSCETLHEPLSGCQSDNKLLAPIQVLSAFIKFLQVASTFRRTGRCDCGRRVRWRGGYGHGMTSRANSPGTSSRGLLPRQAGARTARAGDHDPIRPTSCRPTTRTRCRCYASSPMLGIQRYRIGFHRD